MVRYIANAKGQIVGEEEAEPVCQEDYCDACGDCLVCYAEDPCYSEGDDASEDGHMWVRYLKPGEAMPEEDQSDP